MKKALSYSKKLEKVGLTREQAEVHLEILSDVVEDEMATKADLLKFQTSAENSFESVEQSLERIRIEFEAEVSALETRLTYRMGLMIASAVAVLTGIQAWLS